jgi:hypothetical protein
MSIREQNKRAVFVRFTQLFFATLTNNLMTKCILALLKNYDSILDIRIEIKNEQRLHGFEGEDEYDYFGRLFMIIPNSTDEELLIILETINMYSV